MGLGGESVEYKGALSPVVGPSDFADKNDPGEASKGRTQGGVLGAGLRGEGLRKWEIHWLQLPICRRPFLLGRMVHLYPLHMLSKPKTWEMVAPPRSPYRRFLRPSRLRFLPGSVPSRTIP